MEPANKDIKILLNKYGIGYALAAQMLGIDNNTVNSWFRTNNPNRASQSSLKLLTFIIKEKGLQPVV